MAFLDNQGVRTLVEQTKALVNKKVDKVPGKGLSTNDLTDELLAKIQSGTGSGSGMSVAEKAKLDGIAEGATRVGFTQSATEGAAIGDITINGTKTTLYSPTTMTSDISMNGNKLTGVKNPTNGTDAANKQYVDDAVANAATGGEIDLSGYMKISGETAMDGDLDMDNNSIENVYNFTADFVVAHSLTSDNVVADNVVAHTQLTLGNNTNGTVQACVATPVVNSDKSTTNCISFYSDSDTSTVILDNIAAPTSGLQAANKNYVDEAIANVAAGEPIDLSGYVKKSGDTLTGELTVGQGDGKGIQLGTNGFVNATIGDNKKATVLAANSVRTLVGTDSNKLQLRGNADRPEYITNSKTYTLPRNDEVLLADGSNSMTGNLDLGNNQVNGVNMLTFNSTSNSANKDIVGIFAQDMGGTRKLFLTGDPSGIGSMVALGNIESPTSENEAANKKYVDTRIDTTQTAAYNLVNNAANNIIDNHLPNYLPLAGGKMDGSLNMNSNSISNITSMTAKYITSYGGGIDFYDEDSRTSSKKSGINVYYDGTANVSNTTANVLRFDGMVDGAGVINTVLRGISEPKESTDAANKQYVDDKVAGLSGGNVSGDYLPLSGGTLTGALNMGSKKITNLADPTANSDAANKKYVDNMVANADFLPTNGGSLTGNLNMNGKNISSVGSMAVNYLTCYGGGFGLYTGGFGQTGNLTGTSFVLYEPSKSTDPLVLQLESTVGGVIDSSAGTMLRGIATPTDEMDAANKKYVDDKVASVSGGASGNYLPIDGGYLEGALTLNSHGVTAITLSVSDTIGTSLVGASIKPLANTADAEGNTVSRVKLDALDKATVALKGKPILLENIATPTSEYQAVNKKYVDAKFASVSSGGGLDGDIAVSSLTINDDRDDGASIIPTARVVDGDKVESAALRFEGMLATDDRTVLRNIATPVDSYDAANKKYIDDRVNTTQTALYNLVTSTANSIIDVQLPKYLPLAGGKMTGSIDLNTRSITNAGNVLSQCITIGGGEDLSDYGAYFEPDSDKINGDGKNSGSLILYGNTGDDTVILKNIGTPTSEYEAANKKYVDSAVDDAINALKTQLVAAGLLTE